VLVRISPTGSLCRLGLNLLHAVGHASIELSCRKCSVASRYERRARSAHKRFESSSVTSTGLQFAVAEENDMFTGEPG
jgi:hypothetical protein